MKKLAALLFAIIFICAFIVPSTAADAEILKGTPTVDASLDSIYTQSLCIKMSPEIAKWSYNSGNDVTLTSYYLYDDNYLYICHVGIDKDIVAADEKLTNGDPASSNPWQNDSI